MVFVAMAMPALVHAQTCAACYNNAAAQTPGLLHALRTGILVMMFPSLSLFIVIFVVAFRRRNSFNVDGDVEMGFNRDLKKDVEQDVATSMAARLPRNRECGGNR